MPIAPPPNISQVVFTRYLKIAIQESIASSAVSQSITEDIASVQVTEAIRAREATMTPARKSDAMAEFLILLKKMLITGTKTKDVDILPTAKAGGFCYHRD